MTRKQINSLVKRVLIALLLSIIPPLTIVILTNYSLPNGLYNFFYIFSGFAFVLVGEMIYTHRKNKEQIKDLHKDKE